MLGDNIAAMPQDNLCTRGVQTTAGSRVLRGHVPAYDATAVARLRAAGAVLVGKTNMDSFGMGSSTENSDFGVRPAGSKSYNQKLKHLQLSDLRLDQHCMVCDVANTSSLETSVRCCDRASLNVVDSISIRVSIAESSR